jgi:hypothetical protein
VDEITDFTSMNIEIIVKDWMTKKMELGNATVPFEFCALKALTYLTSLNLLEKNDHKNSKKSSKFIKSKSPITLDFLSRGIIFPVSLISLKS